MKIIKINKKLNLNYIVKEKKEVGIVLNGNEAKTIRDYGIDISNSYVIFKDDQLYLINAVVNIRQNINTFFNNNPSRTKLLLAHKREIKKWLLYKMKNNYAIIPSKVYYKNNYIKVEIAFCKGRKKHDKKQYLKEKEINKEKRNYF